MKDVQQITPSFTVYPPELLPFPDALTVEFAKKALEFFGADVSKIRKNWCYTDFAREYPEYRRCFERLIQLATMGSPPRFAFHMAVNKISTPEFAEEIITQCAETGVGDPCWLAYSMAVNKLSTPAFAKKIIRQCAERGIGNPAYAASYMVGYGISEPAFESEIKAIIANRKEQVKHER